MGKEIKFAEYCAPCLRTIEKALAEKVRLTIISGSCVRKTGQIATSEAVANYGDCRVLMLERCREGNGHRRYYSDVLLAEASWWGSIYGE